MYNRQPCVTDDSYQLSYEHLRQLECSGHFRPSPEVSAFKFVSGRQQVPDGEKECLDSRADVEAGFGAGDYHSCSVPKDMEFRIRTDDLSSVFTASVLDRALTSSLASESSFGIAAGENGKRPLSHFCDGVVNKRARQENEAAKLEHFDGISFVILPQGKLSDEAGWARATAGVSADVKNCEAGYEVNHQITVLDQPEDVHFQFSDHSHWRNVPVGPDHQADLPEWTARDSYIALENATTSYADHNESSDKWLGTCVMPMPSHNSISMEVQSCYSKIVCDCADGGSINCVRKHVMEAREELTRALGEEDFIRMGFSHMGEIIAQRWTEDEENLFHEVVSSNPESVGRNFWIILRKTFASSSFKELVSYYFNVFILRKRAHQNRFDQLNVDSDNDEWQESSDAEFAEEGDEEEDSVMESPSLRKVLSLKNDASEVVCEEHLVGAEEDEACKEFKSKLMPAIPTLDRNSTVSAEDRDAQDRSCTAYDGLNNVSVVNNLEFTNDGILNLADYDHIDGTNNKEIDSSRTDNVSEEVFGKGSPRKAARDGSDFC